MKNEYAEVLHALAAGHNDFENSYKGGKWHLCTSSFVLKYFSHDGYEFRIEPQTAIDNKAGLPKIDIDIWLALAIGHKVNSLEIRGTNSVWILSGNTWRKFDHEDWDVISPIAQWYGSFPVKVKDGWMIDLRTVEGKTVVTQTPQRSIAMAVIESERANGIAL